MPDQKKAKKDLRCIARVFKKLKLPLFLCYGTALGAYRDNDFLPEEKFDLDLGTFGKIHKGVIWEELKQKGFTGRWTTMKREHYGYLPIKRNVMVDLFFFVDKGDCYKSFAKGNQVCATLEKQYSKFKKIKFLGNNYLIPSPTEMYLAGCYGDWKDKSNRKHGHP